VVVSTSGGTAEGVVDGETGYCVAPGDEAALADRLLRILTDPARRAQMSVAARAHMERAFNLRTQTAVLEGIYADVIARAARD